MEYIGNMRFDVPCVNACLVKNRKVYTVRSWAGYGAVCTVNVPGIGLCSKKRVMRVSKADDLEPYVALSGFNSAAEWWNKVVSFGAVNGWLFEVTVVTS